MLDRIEEDGTLYSYASATMFMIYSLLAMGISKTPRCQKAVSGIKVLFHHAERKGPIWKLNFHRLGYGPHQLCHAGIRSA
ncbi:hypothetical protein PO124_03525 [Bacillus licheniformis]|nr:hypothetical protein [Bacillus licheniformis]